MREKLTDRRVEQLKPADRRIDIWDANLPAFGIRINSNGSKTWIAALRRGGSSSRITLGRFPTMRIAEARAQARALMTGETAAPTPRSVVFADFVARFLAHGRDRRGRPVRPATMRDVSADARADRRAAPPHADHQDPARRHRLAAARGGDRARPGLGCPDPQHPRPVLRLADRDRRARGQPGATRADLRGHARQARAERRRDPGDLARLEGSVRQHPPPVPAARRAARRDRRHALERARGRHLDDPGGARKDAPGADAAAASARSRRDQAPAPDSRAGLRSSAAAARAASATGRAASRGWIAASA